MRWDETFEITNALEATYPEEDLSSLTLVDLEELVIDLNDFADDPEEATPSKLQAIYDAWLDLREE